MTKKAWFFLVVLLTLPNLASAFNYWSITSSTTPAVSGAITPPSGEGYVTSGGVTNITSSTITTADYTVAQALPGYTLSYVMIDGVRFNAPNYGTFYRVSKGTKVNHTIAASYNTVKYTITTSKTGSGYIDPTVQVVAGSSKTITMTPNLGYRIASVADGGATRTDGDGVSFAAYTFTNIQSNKSISVTFEPIPTVDANLTTSASTIVQGTQLIVDGTSSTSSVPASYNWSVTPVAGTTLTPAADGKSATFSSSALGSYTITLTVSAPGVTPDSAWVTVSVVSPTYMESAICTGCHNDRSPVIVADYSASTHFIGAEVSCQNCHDPNSNLPHYFNLRPTTVSRSSFLILDAIVGTTGTSYCALCHTSDQVAQSAAHATVPCATCHKNVHYPDIANAGISADYCSTCHGVSAPAIPAISAGHAGNCSGCHGSVAHTPHASDGIAANPCLTCHNKPNSAHYHLVGTTVLDGTCSGCHSGTNHDPQLKVGVVTEHFNGYTSLTNPSYAAAYATPVTACANCHKGGNPGSLEDNVIDPYRTDWAGSGHGDVRGRSWLNAPGLNWKAAGVAGAKVRDMGLGAASPDCIRCHSAAGYVQFTNLSSIAPLASAAQRYSEPLTCNACHNPDFTPRSVSARTGYYNYSSALTGKLLVSAALPDSRTSNICLGCHIGRTAGDTIKAMAVATAHRSYSSSFWQDVPLVNSHYLSAGGQVFGITGYEYPGQGYASPVDHSRVGSALAGPCVTCHMPAQKHTMDVASTSYSQCDSCHDGTVNASFVAGRMAGFNAALQALGTALAQRGFAPSQIETLRNWGNKDLGPGNMGAAFNYNLLLHDRGAFAHNPTYVKRLLRDSIDYLTSGGTVDRSRDLTGTISALLTDATQRADANAFLAGSTSASASCDICHSETLDPSSGVKITVAYNASKHASEPGGATCGSCHAPDQTAAHPPEPMLSTKTAISEKCQGCHELHPWPSQGRCLECHNGHEPMLVKVGYPHFSSYSTAQYVAGSVSCTGCHKQAGSNDFQFYPAHVEWAGSGHGNPVSTAYIGPEPYSAASLETYDFKFLGTPLAKPANTAGQDCVRCHTSTGYVNYVTPTDPEDKNTAFSVIRPWGTPGDRSREMVGCPACHTPTPFDAGFGRRSVGIDHEDSGTTVVKAWFNYSSAATKRIVRSKFFVNSVSDMVDSNICIACHSGRAAGDLIRQAANCNLTPSIACRLGGGIAANGLTGIFWDQVDFIDPHGGAAGFIYPDNLRPGYEYRPSAANADHIDVGKDTTQGPCVGCHMSSSNKHSFSVLSSATNGVIGAISSGKCVTCHKVGGEAFVIDADILESKRANYQAALALIKGLLVDKGVHYNAAKPPYFFTTSETSLQNSATRTVRWYYNATYQGAHLMGAAFNLRLLDTDAAWVHNGTYARRLLYDTIDYLDDGALNLSVTVQSQSLHDYLKPPF